MRFVRYFEFVATDAALAYQIDRRANSGSVAWHIYELHMCVVKKGSACVRVFVFM